MNQILLKTTKFNVERRVYHLPGREPVKREVVVHPGAVLIIPLLTPHTIVMIRNYRCIVHNQLLELPAGTLEPTEAPIDCAARELEEETGYKTPEIQPLCRFYTSPGFTDELMHVFVANNLTQTDQKLDANEQIRVQITTLERALADTTDGKIIDAKTIAALHVYNYHIKRKT
ncbi:MAG: NUDIX hydrolase [Planctomycetota bacterium]|jgi:ADP-ribose pyrophosphatase